MDGRNTFGELITYYSDLALADLKVVVEKRENVRNEFRAQCSRFVECLNAFDSSGVKSALENINRILEGENRLFYAESDDEKLIAGFSDFVPIVGRVRNGEGSDDFSKGYFNPFLGTPDEMLELCRIGGDKYYHPVTAFLYGVWGFIRDGIDDPSPLSNAVCRYTESWLKRVVDIVEENISFVLQNTGEMFNKHNPDGIHVLSRFLVSLISEVRLESVCTYAFNVFHEYLSLIESGVGKEDSLINAAVRYGSEKAFDTLISIEKFDIERVEIYPERSTSILDKLFSLGMLLPGTEEGRAAFFECVGNMDPEEEIIRRTIHPSYFRRKMVDDMSPLSWAVKNDRLSPAKYFLLIRGEDDLNGRNEYTLDMPPVGYAVERGNIEAVKELFRLGADMNWHDRWGNNIFHYIYSGRWYSHTTKAEIEDIFEKNFNEDNIFGHIPFPCSLFDNRNLLEDYEKITVASAAERIFSSGMGREASSLFCVMKRNPGFSLSKVIDTVRRNLEKRESRAEIMRVGTFDELERLYVSFSTQESVVIFISELYPIYAGHVEDASKMLEALYARDNVAVIAATEFHIPGIVDSLIGKGIRNLFIGNTESELYSTIFLSRSGAEALKDYEFILKSGDDFFLVDFSDEI